MTNDQATKSGPKWIGTLLSVIFPCFGFVWAGQYKRAACWLAALIFSGTLAMVLLSFDEVPPAVGIAFLFVAISVQLKIWIKSYQRGRLNIGRWIALIIYAVVYLTTSLPAYYLMGAFLISTESMSPTLLGHMKNDEGDRILVNKLSYLSSEPQRGDIIAFDTSKVPELAKTQGPDSWTYYTFRVLGLPGEQLERGPRGSALRGVQEGQLLNLNITPQLQRIRLSFRHLKTITL